MSHSTVLNGANPSNNIPTQPLLLTYLQAGKLLGVSDRTVWALVNEGKLKAVRFAGRTVRIDRRDLETFIEGHKTGPSLSAPTGKADPS